MPATDYELRNRIREELLKSPGFNRKEFARENGINERTLFRHIAAIKKEKSNENLKVKLEEEAKLFEEKMDIEIEEDEIFINCNTVDTGDANKVTITGVDAAVAWAKVDTEKWEVVKQRISTSQVTMKLRVESGRDEDGKPVIVHKPETFTNWHVRVWLKPKTTTDALEALKLFIKEVPKCKTPIASRKFPKGDYALEIALYDAHIGKFAWEQETDAPNYDTKIACYNFVDAAKRLIAQTNGIPISKIFFPIGNDFMHVENLAGTTYMGKHALDHDSRMPHIYSKAKAAFLEAVYMCREIAPVEILYIPGNHDIHVSFIMCDAIAEHFRNCEWVTVDAGPSWRKVRTWGDLMVGFAHDAAGRKAKVTVNSLPQFWPEEWGKSKWREWHVGHKHKKHEEKFIPTQTVGSVIVRQIATLSPIDAWHYQNLFVDAVPAGEAFIWEKRDGVVSHLNANIHFDSKKRA